MTSENTPPCHATVISDRATWVVELDDPPPPGALSGVTRDLGGLAATDDMLQE